MGKIPWKKKWQPTPVFLPGKSHRQKSLVGYSPWVTKDQTRLSTKAHIHYQWYYIHSPPHATFTPIYLQNFQPFPTETLYPLNNNSSISSPAAPVVKCRFSCVRLCVTLWTVAHQALLSVGFSREEYWSGLPCPPPGILLNPGIKTASLMSHALAGRFFTAQATWEAAPCILVDIHICINISGNHPIKCSVSVC